MLGECRDFGRIRQVIDNFAFTLAILQVIAPVKRATIWWVGTFHFRPPIKGKFNQPLLM
jgi:hypothetical protein